MAKLSLINREKKREKLVKKFEAKRQNLLKIINNQSIDEADRYEARLKLQSFPRNANPTRLRSRCGLTGRPRGTFKLFGLSRLQIREIAMRGEIPGVTKASW